MGDLYREKPCIDCGKVVRMHIKSKRCKSCQETADRMHDAAHKRAKAAGHTRLLGSKSVCEACGKKYIVTNGKQRYCPECAPYAVNKNIRQEACARYARRYGTKEAKEQRNERRRVHWQTERVCRHCGKPFLPESPMQVCCTRDCQEARSKAITQKSEQKRKEKRRQRS